ncbi:GT4 family glycosyltransferase PelF [Corynebacterium testudinoris]|uniref:GT4 family glycosyltransferase PelF n=1 Tax=Corynebacterium testudinoris TaxID=136857 RepID=UPI001C8CB4D5|nr:GT4 family glycosyltransferase PelF [Corynebacterium testudinoris]MBX8996091.1 GT4 family glycosyltransferase PelF [Corynebacterium testudinoris]
MVNVIIRLPGEDVDLPRTDVALVMESTYPFLKGGVSAVVHDIVTNNPHLTFGIVHITWDSSLPRKDIYGMPPNVRWIDVVYLSLDETREAFSQAMSGKVNEADAVELLDAIATGVEGDASRLFDLYDQTVNPLTRTRTLWPVLQAKATMDRVLDFVGQAKDISLGKAFWQVRDYFSLVYALLDRVQAPADVYHAHTTGYAAMVAAVAAHQRGGRFLLTEHNLYIRDTINYRLDRPLNLNVDDSAPDTLSRGTDDRMWLTWWILMGKIIYPLVDRSTYLFPQIIDHAATLGANPDRAEVLPNGVVWERFKPVRQSRRRALDALSPDKEWKIACIARVVPIKGIRELIYAAEILAKEGVDNITIDVLGPTDEIEEYYEECLELVEQLGLEGRINFRGAVVIHEELQHYDALILSSFNEGQPIVVLEAMAAGLPILGTDVGGMQQLVLDTLRNPRTGKEFGPCGQLVPVADSEGLARMMKELSSDQNLYRTWHNNSLSRVRTIFLMPDVMRRYNELYQELRVQASGLTRRNLAATARARWAFLPRKSKHRLRKTT